MTDSAHSVLSEDREGVRGVWEEPTNHDTPPADPHLPRPIGDAVCTLNACGSPAALTLDAVGEIRTTAPVQRFRPLQSHHSIINLRDDAARGRRRFWTNTQTVAH